VRGARARADAVVRDARHAADRDAASTPGASAVATCTERERTSADALLERERAAADATLDHERRAICRSLRHFLQAERMQTDDSLGRERVICDDVIGARDDVLATVSHDLRALLGALSIASELVAKAVPLDDANREA